MTTVSLDVVSPGPLASIQDRGRRGLRRVGIPWAGVLAPAWQTLANTLVGNAVDHPVIECFEGGLTLESSADGLCVAVAGDASVESVNADGDTRIVHCFRSYRLAAGERVKVMSSGRTRCSYVAIHGLDVRIHHGSASTYSRAGLGGLNGEVLKSGDQLIADIPPKTLLELGVDATEALTAMLPVDGVLPLHAVSGPQQDAFSDNELARFFDTDWSISTETDRMGSRLDGATIEHLNQERRDIVSDAIVPGAVQVPGNGRPILMLADAATIGGYPKIATVTSGDLPLIALARPGTAVRFVACSVEEAVARTRATVAHTDRLLASIAPVTRVPTTAKLLECNLIDGVVDAAHTDRRTR